MLPSDRIYTMKAIVNQIRSAFPEMEILENEPMKKHCSFCTGGPVPALLMPQNEEILLQLLDLLSGTGAQYYILGNGTNVVFSDEGSACFVISTENLQGLTLADENCISAQAGVTLSRLASFAQEHSLTGLEFASGIPGSVGGGILMNAGAYGGEMKDCTGAVRCCSKDGRTIREYSGEDCGFRYRHSMFQEGEQVILSAVFRLRQGEKGDISAKMKELNIRRRDKQPLNLPSAGSAFRRPAGHYAAALIEQCGLKGTRIGGAQVSEKHAGFIVNTGTATTADLEALLTHVSTTVKEKTGIDLQREIILLP